MLASMDRVDQWMSASGKEKDKGEEKNQGVVAHILAPRLESLVQGIPRKVVDNDDPWLFTQMMANSCDDVPNL